MLTPEVPIRRKPERPQKGNPHQLTFNQHVWPKRSIERFADATKRVNLFDKVRKKTRIASSNDTIFCAKRAWDQRAEVATQSIEGDFQILADEIIAERATTLDQKQNVIADAFYALWWARSELRTAGEDTAFKSVTGYRWPKDLEEDIERHCGSFIREGGVMPDRFLRGFRIQWEIDRLLPELSRAQWGIMRAQEGHLIVPDHPGQHPVIPLTPTLCLCWGQTGTVSMPWQQVAVINRYFNLMSREYLFAQDLPRCPLNPNAPTAATWQALKQNAAMEQAQ